MFCNDCWSAWPRLTGREWHLRSTSYHCPNECAENCVYIIMGMPLSPTRQVHYNIKKNHFLLYDDNISENLYSNGIRFVSLKLYMRWEIYVAWQPLRWYICGTFLNIHSSPRNKISAEQIFRLPLVPPNVSSNYWVTSLKNITDLMRYGSFWMDYNLNF